MQISEAASGTPATGSEPCRFPKLEECAHFHYERVQLPKLTITLQSNTDQSLHSQHSNDEDDVQWYMVQVTSGDECWLLQRNFANFQMLDAQLHQCIYDRKIFQLPDLSSQSPDDDDIEDKLRAYLERFSRIVDNNVNCGPVLNWLQMDNKGHRLLVPSEESRSINTPAVAAAYSVRRYVSQARDELNLEVGDMISVIDMASPGESMWWRGKRGFQVGFFPQHCVHIIGDKVPRNMPLPPPVVGSLALTPIKPVLRKHGKLITFFRSFILNRPSRRRLKQSGILKERVFGCDLGEHLLNSGHDIPMVLKCCAEFIEKNGIVDGIYRLSGITSNIQKLRNAFDEDRVPNLYTDEILQDIHSVASLLKMYFRELPNPLCTYQLYQSFVNAVQGSSTIRNSESDHDRLIKMREAVQKLPPPHYRTLEYLMRHLAKVAKHGSRTGMTTRNVAIVWAPNLLRCAELEVGGVAALQGVGVQAVVTEFLICYADLIFSDRFPNVDLHIVDRNNETNNISSPKKCRPKSLAISTPTKLITLEEARTKHLLNKNEDCNYIEVGGGPKNLPKKYHTIIELPSSARKRSSHTKRSPLGWRSLFTKSRTNNNTQNNLKNNNNNRKASTPVTITIADKSITESDLTDMKRKLRTVKSAESLTSGHSEPTTSGGDDVLGPLYSLNKPQGHNRSVSHDSYFDTLQNSQNNSEGSLLDLSEIQLNFELEESEMRIFSEDESLICSPKMQKDLNQRRVLTRARPEEFTASATNSGNPSPKKQARVVLSPDSMSRKRTRLEDQLSDIQYIDCNTPDLVTTALIHPPEPKNKSPRNSDNFSLDTSEKRTSFISTTTTAGTTPTPQSPAYKLLEESNNSTPDFDNSYPKYENILTTISITYKSPTRNNTSESMKNNIYENVIINPEKAIIPTSCASLPPEQAQQPDLLNVDINKERPKSLSALEDLSSSTATTTTTTTDDKDETLRPLSSSAICDTSEKLSISYEQNLSSIQSSRSNLQYTPSLSSGYHIIDDLSPGTDLSLSEIINSSTENLSSSHSISFESKNFSPNVSPDLNNELSVQPQPPQAQSSTAAAVVPSTSTTSPCDKRKSEDNENIDDQSIYQQVKVFRRSIHEVNALLDIDLNVNNGVNNKIIINKEEQDINKEKEEEDKENKEIITPPCQVTTKEKQIFSKIEENKENNNNDDDDDDEENYDSLESDNHVYENIETEKIMTEEKLCVKELKNKFEEINSTNPTPSSSSSSSATTAVGKKFYEKDSLPPCLRARNLKYQFKTRSLDEEEFKKECTKPLTPSLISKSSTLSSTTATTTTTTTRRRKSMDEGMGYKTNSLPKTLNPPKILLGDDEKLNSIHLAHSTENINKAINDEEQKKRERIEKYKEERRRFLQDKYRSESFKEDKDILLSKLKIYNKKDDKNKIYEENDSLDETTTTTKSDNSNNSLKTRAVIFEQSDKNHDFLRKKKDDLVFEKRRHTFENRERESEVDRLRRISLDNKSPRKEKASPTYSIKDMKAIFESKSKQ